MDKIRKCTAMSGLNPDKVHYAYQYGNKPVHLLCRVHVQHVWEVQGLEVTCERCIAKASALNAKYGR